MTDTNMPPTFDVPPNIVIDGLRNEVARLNDERLSMLMKLEFQAQIIEALKHQLQHASDHDHDHDHDVADHVHEDAPVQD